MPPRKRHEGEFGKMMRSYGFFTHKWRDRGYINCPKCHKLLKYCPICEKDMLLEKAQTYPDHFLGPLPIYVECKEGAERFLLSDVSKMQHRAMEQAVADGWLAYLFLAMGEGSLPDGRAAYLIPWEQFLQQYSWLKEQNIASIIFTETARSKNPTAVDLFSGYRLEWVTGRGWSVPAHHYFWLKLDQYVLDLQKQIAYWRNNDEYSPQAPAGAGKARGTNLVTRPRP